jgi:hypothetical protein
MLVELVGNREKGKNWSIHVLGYGSELNKIVQYVGLISSGINLFLYLLDIA